MTTVSWWPTVGQDQSGPPTVARESTQKLITLPTLDLGEPKRPLALQRERHDIFVLDVHRLVRDEIEFVPSTERFGTERERHLEVVASRLGGVVVVGVVGGWCVRRVWLSLDEVGDQDARAFEPPVSDVEPL